MNSNNLSFRFSGHVAYISSSWINTSCIVFNSQYPIPPVLYTMISFESFEDAVVKIHVHVASKGRGKCGVDPHDG